MNILVVGGGGREHALVMKLAESKKTEYIVLRVMAGFPVMQNADR